MASVRDLKKDINYVLGDIMDAVYIVEAANGKQDSKEGSKIIDGAIETFDSLITKVNQRDVENRKAHLKSVRAELETKAKGLVDELNKLN
jgi:DNA-binding transcriptional regulator GbsR (MarR family)